MEPMPDEVADEVDALDRAVRATLPPRTTSNVLIGTWNLRAFSSLTRSWAAPATASPKRDLRAMALIAAIIKPFDVVAVQEARRDTTALRVLVEVLGSDWKFLCSDVTEGDAGNGERLAYLYDSTRVNPSGLVGELVLPPNAEGAQAQFVRTPYAVSFARRGIDFILTTVHVIWAAPQDRIPEVTAFAQWMHDWAARENDWNGNLLVLGDFNLEGPGTPLYQTFVSTGLFPPGQFSKLPRTIFDDPGTPKFYDQVAWFSSVDDSGEVTSMLSGMSFNGQAGNFDFLPHVYEGMSKTQLSWRISDHYPL